MALTTTSPGRRSCDSAGKRPSRSGRQPIMVIAILGTLLAVGSVEAYLLFGDGRADIPVRSDFARPWAREVWGPGATLRYEIAQDPHFEVYFDSPDGALPYTRRGLAAWSGIPTADILWETAGASGEVDEADPQVETPALDGRNTIFVDSEREVGGYARSWRERFGTRWMTVECDVALGAGYARIPEEVEPEDLDRYRERRRERSVYTLVHEFGHCLGLGHAGDLSVVHRWNRGMLLHPGDPAMSYGYDLERPDDLAADDVVGASLLRPTRRWMLSTGSISGVVKVEDEPAPYIHVWALPVDKDPLQDRVGVFTDADGEFLIEGLDPGNYAFWAQPVASQGANQWIPALGGVIDLDDTLPSGLVRIRAGRITEDVEISMRQGRTTRAPPEPTSPRSERQLVTSNGGRGEIICSGVRFEAERPYPADGPLWFARRQFSLAHDRWVGTTVAVEWPSGSGGAVLDWVGPYRNWWWIREDDEEKAMFFHAWERGGGLENLGARSPRLDVSIADYRIEQTSSSVRHLINFAWPESTEVRLRFRSEDDACDGEPIVVCDLSGCELKQ